MNICSYQYNRHYYTKNIQNVVILWTSSKDICRLIKCKVVSINYMTICERPWVVIQVNRLSCSNLLEHSNKGKLIINKYPRTEVDRLHLSGRDNEKLFSFFYIQDLFAGWNKLASTISGEWKWRKWKRNMKMFQFLQFPDFEYNRDTWKKSLGIISSRVETDPIHPWTQSINHIYQLTTSSIFICSRRTQRRPATWICLTKQWLPLTHL